MNFAFLAMPLRLFLFQAPFRSSRVNHPSSSSFDDNASPRALCTVEGGQVFVSDDINLCVRRRGPDREI